MKTTEVPIDLNALRILVTEITRELGFAVMNYEEAALHNGNVAQQAELLGFAADASHNAHEAMGRLETLIDGKAAKAEALARMVRTRKGGK